MGEDIADGWAWTDGAAATTVLDGALDAQAQTALLELDLGQAGLIENGGKLAQQIGIVEAMLFDGGDVGCLPLAMSSTTCPC